MCYSNTYIRRLRPKRSDALSRLALAISQLIETLYSAPLALHLRNNPTPGCTTGFSEKKLARNASPKVAIYTRDYISITDLIQKPLPPIRECPIFISI